MFKKFLDGLAFGTGFGITFVAIWFIAYYFVLPGMLESRFNSINTSQIEKVTTDRQASNVLKTPPAISTTPRFLGSTGRYSGDFIDNKSGVLASGPGKIIGHVTADGKAVEGLKLRLALNGRVMSQWAATDKNGQYIIPVPYGEYKIDGYELNHASSNKTLSGMIGHPQMAHSSETFNVSSDSSGYGLKLKFVRPVVKNIAKKRLNVSEQVMIKWKPYPNATQYRIQIHEKTEAHGYSRSKQLFEWHHRPLVEQTKLDLSDFFDTALKPGHFYNVEIDALDDNMNLLSKTDRNYNGYDFEIVN